MVSYIYNEEIEKNKKYMDFLKEMVILSGFATDKIPFNPLAYNHVNRWFQINNTQSKEFKVILLEDNEPIGSLWAKNFDNNRLTDNLPELSIAIKKEYQNKGYGTLLLKHSMEIIEKEFDKIAIQVSTKNIYALDLFNHIGFKETQRNGSNIIMIKDFK